MQTTAIGSLEATADTLEPTTGSYNDVDVRLTFTLPEGWENNGWSVNTANSFPGAGVVFGHVANVFTDPCHWVEIAPTPGPSVDDLASTFADVPALDGFRRPMSPSTDSTDSKSNSRSPTTTRTNAFSAGSVCSRNQALQRRVPTTGPNSPTSSCKCGSSTSTAPAT